MWYAPAQNAVRGTWYAVEQSRTGPGESTPGTAERDRVSATKSGQEGEEIGAARAGEESKKKRNGRRGANAVIQRAKDRGVAKVIIAEGLTARPLALVA